MRVWPPIASPRLRKWFAVGTFLFIVGTLAGILVFENSEPMEFGTHFARTDPRVIAVTGMPEKVGRVLTRSFRYTFGDRSGSASMTLRSQTPAGSFDVELSLTKQAGRWSVERAYIYPPQGEPVAVVESPCRPDCR